jgi:hypothetical protein
VSLGSIYLDSFQATVGGPEINFNPTILRILRVFRVTRLIRVFNASLGLQALLTTIARSLPAVINVAAIMLFLFFIYACAGVEMFGRQGCVTSDCEGISKYGNFHNFLYAMLTLFRVATADNGYGLLKDMSRAAPLCNDAIDCEHDCCTPGGSLIAIGYFVTFMIFAKLVLLNIVVAILMTQLSDASEEVLLMAIESQSEANSLSLSLSELNVLINSPLALSLPVLLQALNELDEEDLLRRRHGGGTAAWSWKATS